MEKELLRIPTKQINKCYYMLQLIVMFVNRYFNKICKHQ